MENITLYYREGSSDKIYQVILEPEGDGHVVNFAYGRRGSTLQTGCKTSTPVPYEKAKLIYDKLVREKTVKGYSPGESGTPYQHTDKQSQATGILPQLLNPITVKEAVTFVSNPLWVLQQKLDGKRMLLRKTDEEIVGINRTGLITALPQPLVEAAASLPGTFILDGECIGDQLILFDILEHDGEDLRSISYRERLTALMNLVPTTGAHLCTAETAFETAHKAHLFALLRRENKEGVVVKNLLAPYFGGRPASGGDALKCKFAETASFIVEKINQKRSVALRLLDGDQSRPAGNVTVPPNHDLPAVGDVVECRYLYAFKESGCIYQPVYLGVRDDIPFEECTIQQLKFKPADHAQPLKAA